MVCIFSLTTLFSISYPCLSDRFFRNQKLETEKRPNSSLLPLFYFFLDYAFLFSISAASAFSAVTLSLPPHPKPFPPETSGQGRA